MGKNNPITAESLQTQLDAADANTDLKTLAQTAISVLAQKEAEASDSQSQLSTLQEQHDELQAAHSEVKEQLDGALSQVSELGTKLDMQEKTKDQPGLLVMVGDKPKLLLGKRFVIDKKEYTADQVSKSEELLAFLAGKNSGALIDPKQVTDGSTDKSEA